MPAVLRIVSILFGIIALLCSFTWLILVTLVAGPLGIICWIIARQVEKNATAPVPAFSKVLGYVAISVNVVALAISLGFIIMVNVL